ncbi:MAG: helix-turn-helix domain-containing protein [Acidimicrobiales bacterium]
MSDEQSQERRRRDLLNDLYGADVPASIGGQLLRTVDVARLFQVSERTVSEWARQGRIPSVRTPGGHRRYPADQVRRLLEAAEEGYRPPAEDQTSVGDLPSSTVTDIGTRRFAKG